ncbi:hypothetical protein GOV05_02405 [Candidatus Woesearchaeota archaeon]|nr:hypothetical protein [Candidatus Woesearchaeota archaeon]
MNCVIVRYSEIGLKGRNRKSFENELVENLHFYLRKNKVVYSNIRRVDSRIIISTEEDVDVKPVFGISTYSFAKKIKYNLQELIELVVDESKKVVVDKSFRVSVLRSDKNIKETSLELERLLGEKILEDNKTRVSLKDFDVEVGVELIRGDAYVFFEKKQGFYGLPIGSSDFATALIEDENGVLASILLMRRGVFPNKIIVLNNTDITLLAKYLLTQRKTEVLVFDSKKIAENFLEEDPNPLIVNDTTNNIRKEMNTKLILRPLVGFGEEEIINKKKMFA